MRNYLSHDILVAEHSNVSVLVNNAMQQPGDFPQSYDNHVRCLLIDTVTRYRSQYQTYTHEIK